MGVLTQDMKDIAAKVGFYILATCGKDGVPNGVPMGAVRVKDDEIVIADNFMNKTRQNLEENPVAAVSYWSGEDHYGYQIKGKVKIETSGEEFDIMTKRAEERNMPFRPKAVIRIAIDEAYYVGSGKETGTNLLA